MMGRCSKMTLIIIGLVLFVAMTESVVSIFLHFPGAYVQHPILAVDAEQRSCPE
jgi:hypothetical protein